MQESSTSIVIDSPLPIPILLRRCPFSEYKKLAHYHYRSGSPGPSKDTFGLYIPNHSLLEQGLRLIGIIVYSLPPLNNQMRNIATSGRYLAVDDASSRAQLLNRELRTISRVIIDPQFRSLGLAYKLVRITLPMVGRLYVESSAVMGLINPFFEKAGMRKFLAPPDMKGQILLAAFRHVEIPVEKLLDLDFTIRRIKDLSPSDREFLLKQIDKYYITARRAVFSSNIDSRLEWIIPRLASTLLQRPAYFLWKNENY